MVSKGWASALLLLLLSLSGCSDDGDGGESSTSSSSESETASETTTTTSRSSTTTTTAASSTSTTSSSSATTTGPAGNATGNQTGNQTAGPTQHEENGELVAANACQGFFLGDLDNIAHLNFVVDPATYGASYTATVAGEGIAGIRIGFFNDAGENVGGVEFEPPMGPLTHTAPVPDGATSASVVGCGAGPYSAVYDVGAPAA
jgi:hypothetical protein